MVALIKTMMNIEGHLTVAWVNSGGPKEMADAPAWIRMPEKMPMYGTQAGDPEPIADRCLRVGPILVGRIRDPAICRQRRAALLRSRPRQLHRQHEWRRMHRRAH